MPPEMNIAQDYPYLHQRLVEEEANRRHSRHDSAATIKANSDDILHSVLSTAPLHIPAKDNDWLGFCPSAVKLQNGDRKGALSKKKEYHDAYAQSGVNTYACSTKSCAFQGHVSVDFVWKATMVDEKLGLKCRWAFLAKSHLKQGMVTGRQYQYQCPICIFTGGMSVRRIWKGAEIFLGHLASHRSKPLPDEVLQKLNIINDHVADDKEDFDLNLYPNSVSQKPSMSVSTPSLSRASTRTSIVDQPWARKASSTLDIGSGFQRTQTQRSDRADSVVGGAPIDEEPWSEGLSDFKVDKEEDYLSPDF